MTITVKYFGLIADISKKKEEILHFENSDFTVENLKENLIQKYSALNDHSFVIAVNKTIASENLILKNNDTIALLPPFAGG